MAHHQESRDVHAKAPCRLDMLLRHIGLGAMRRDAHRAHAKIIGALEIMDGADAGEQQGGERSEEHTSELQSLMRISYAVFCLKKKKKHATHKRFNNR